MAQQKPVKKTTTKPKLGGEIGRPPFTPAERKKMPKVGNMGSAKNGKSFPDLNKEGRGVIAKKGAKIAKCKYGCK